MMLIVGLFGKLMLLLSALCFESFQLRFVFLGLIVLFNLQLKCSVHFLDDYSSKFPLMFPFQKQKAKTILITEVNWSASDSLA